MSTIPDDQHITDDAASGGRSSRAQALAALREEHAQLGADREPLTLEVPGLEHLAVRYRWYPMSADEKSAQKIIKMRELTDRALLSAVDTLLNACDELVLMDPEDPRADEAGWAPLTNQGEPPVKFDRVLVEVMEWPNPELMSARQIVRRLFGGEKGERALIRHSAVVSEWLESSGEEIRGEFAGK